MQQYQSDAQLAERYSVSRPTIWRWVARGLFPRPVKLSPGTTRWSMADIERHEQSKSAA